MLNNSLLYIDPSGNASQGGGKDCVDCGLSEADQTWIGNGIKTLHDNWDNWGIKDWFNRNINGDKISKWWKSKISFNNLFGSNKSSGPPPNRSSYANIQMPTQHSSFGFNWTYLSQGALGERFIYGVGNTINIGGQIVMGRSVSDGSMRNLDTSSTTTDQGVFALVDIATSIIGVAEARVALSEIRFVKEGNELFNFARAAGIHMTEPGRVVPVQILEQAIKGSKGVVDPRGSRALMHTTEMWRNGKVYNLEVLYDESTNSIWHFKYYTKK